MVANLFGDFVKGRDYSYLPPLVIEGVFLHRQIDDYIDNYSSVKKLRLNLYQELPKIAGIAIDLYFDHLLAKNWSMYHHQSLNQFVDTFTKYIDVENNLIFPSHQFDYPGYFLNLLHNIKKNDLLKKYVHIDGLNMASKGVSKRISFENNLDIAADVFLNNEKEIEHAFHKFMNDAIVHFKKF